MTLEGPPGLTAADRQAADRQNARRRTVSHLNIAPAAEPSEPMVAHSEPDSDPVMRLEVREVDEVNLPSLPSLTGSWAWLLFHGDGSLIAYSDGYATRSSCIAAAKRIGWPIELPE